MASSQSEEAGFRQVLEELRRAGLLLLTDPRLPSVAGLVAGEPIRGSWWGHPRGRAIFLAARKLAAHPDVLAAKLISGKVTYVHRRLWPALLGVATSGEPWQKRGLSRPARALLREVARKGLVAECAGEGPRELENRLLVHSEEVHTETGAHAKRLESWEHWAGRVGFTERKLAAGEAKKELEQALRTLGARAGAGGRLPWQSRTRASSSL